MVAFACILLEHESTMKIHVVHDWLRDVFSLFRTPMDVFTMYDVK